MGDSIRNVSTSAASHAGQAPVPAGFQLQGNGPLRQFIHQSPVLAPVDALQTLLTKSPKSAAPAAIFADTMAEQTQPTPTPALQGLTMAELQRLGAQKDKKAFFQALLPGALESEKTYGVPASVILAQAALESGWGKHAIGGFNLFGIKGEGPAGSRLAWTSEQRGGRRVRIQARFAQFHSVAEAVREHGQVFHNGNYDRALSVFKQTKDPSRFIDAMARTYATNSRYAADLKGMIAQHNLRQLCQQQGGH